MISKCSDYILKVLQRLDRSSFSSAFWTDAIAVYSNLQDMEVMGAGLTQFYSAVPPDKAFMAL